ncbi:WYL domain-containing protein [Chromobacterium haemolyticum]|uniref:WYL domain-containing protein n=1 Tax=Chromobacterium fluminis TaxID=3044269 RepID=A0ABX0LCL3_9NEIS|nr:WYL domain-containing protein [Chromobacterium haemolyticum]NHR07257.1 WYL domain-containing protein [Chromobacterium haemolyticum]
MNTSAIVRDQVLSALPQAQRERLAYIDFRLYFLGELRRADVADRFGTGPAAATRDIAQYRDIASENLELDNSDKAYRPTEEFVPLFDHAPQRVLTALSSGFGEGIGEELGSMVRCEFPIELTTPQMSTLAPITRAIHRGKALRTTYTSIESGCTEREIVPIALVNNGSRWHVRAYDRRRNGFRDFVLTRVETPVLLENSPILEKEKVDQDVQWNRIIELELVPHPRHPRHEVVMMDYGMPDGVLRVKVRAANAGYLLRRWTIDCSPDHRLEGIEFALWLRDPLSLYGASSAHLAPGYVDPKSDAKITSITAM